MPGKAPTINSSSIIEATDKPFRGLKNPAFLALVGAAVVALIYGRVAALNISVGVVGGNLDGYENLWNDYWTRNALLHFKNPYFSDLIYYPLGVSLRYHTLHPLTGLLAIPLWPIFGPIVTTNLFFLLSLWLTVFCGYLLINDFVKSPVCAFAGATLFTYAHANHTLVPFLNGGQTEKLAAQWLPLYLFFMFRLVYRERWRLYAGLSLCALLLLTFTDWQYTMYAVLITVLYAVFALFTRRSMREKLAIWLKLGGVGLVWFGLILFPLLLPMLNESIKNTWMENVSDQSIYHSWDLLDYLLPGTTNPGYPAMLVAVIGLVVAWKMKESREGAKFWAICGGLAAIFAMGPKLTVADNVTGIPLPYALLYKLPVLSAGRDPARFYSVAMLAFGVLFAFGLQYLWQKSFFIPALAKLAVPRRQVVVSALILALMGFNLFGYLVESGKAHADPLDVPEFYQELGKDPEQYAILEVPLFTDKGRKEAIYQAYQAYHHKFRFGGRYARDHKLSNPNNFVKRTTFYRDFFWQGSARQSYYRPANGKDFLAQPDLGQVGLPLLNYYNVRYVVLWKEAMPEPGRLDAQRNLLKVALGQSATPVYQDARMEAYKVPQEQPRASKVVLDVGDGWHVTESDNRGQFRWADPDSAGNAELYATNLTGQPVRAVLKTTLFTFVPAGEKQPRLVKVDINGYAAGSASFPEFGDEKPIEIELTIPPGFNIINFTSPEASRPASNQPGTDNRTLSFGARAISLQVLN